MSQSTQGAAQGTAIQHRVRMRHPLEIIPFFSRIPPSAPRNLLYTLIWNSLFALIFALLSLILSSDAAFGHVLWVCFVIANCIGFVITAGFWLGRQWFDGWLCRQALGMRALYYAVVSIIGVFVGYWIGFSLLGWRGASEFLFSASGAISVVLLTVLISTILSSIFFARERQARAEAAFQGERARVEAAERQFHLARFKLLEAQVEPHFLYNTLANVISLVDPDPSAAKRMLERLIDYLRGSAVAAGTGTATLGTQLALLRSYLDLIVLRMGKRLSYRIDVPSDLEALPLPPMLLQPLVENAIKHGLEPKIAGGEVVVSARRLGGDLVLSVADDGLGVRVAPPPGSTGLGLANLRERLATLYGTRARLKVDDSHPGTRATVVLPVDALAPAP